MKIFLLTIVIVLVSASRVLDAQTVTENWVILPPTSYPKVLDAAGDLPADDDLIRKARLLNLTSGDIVDMGAYEFQCAALPVKMSPLRGTLNKDNLVLLTWHTYTELNSKGFLVPYGAGGPHFESGLFETSKALDGNSRGPLDYSVNAGSLTAIKYYRLKQMDLNGYTTYCKIILIAEVNTGFNINAYPNPAHDLINIHLDGVRSPNGQITIIDASGRSLKRQDITAVNSAIDLSGLAADVSILKYKEGVHDSSMAVIKNELKSDQLSLGGAYLILFISRGTFAL